MKMRLFFLIFFVCNIGFSQTDTNTEIIQKPKLKRSRQKLSSSFEIDSKIPEGSGLTAWNGRLWTHNDSDDSRIFALDTLTGKIVDEFKLPVRNIDWEEISQDETYFYLGDFGNNLGKRELLCIYRIRKMELLEHRIILDTISFSWPNKINPDCEAMALIGDSIYLFTKEWKCKRQTRVFSLPNKPGKYEANYKSTLKTKVLVTGASFDPSKKRLVLCGYNLVLRPFLLVFEDFPNADFFSGKGRRIKIRKRFRQIEGITTFGGKNYYIINENFKTKFIRSKRSLQKVLIP